MPPRIPLFQCLKAPSTTPSISTTRGFTSSSQCNASTGVQRRKHRDPYAIAQAKARKAANISRQQVLKQERDAALGDPVRGVVTPYVESFDTALPSETTSTTRKKDDHLNYFLSRSELDKGLTHSKWLSTPAKPFQEDPNSKYEGLSPAAQQKERDEHQKTAAEALKRISSLSLASGGDRMRVNKMRCIEDFGRHSTDDTLTPMAPASTGRPHSLPEKTPRAGPDTGSSEVQVAILTAKIRSLDQFLQGRGRQDKNGKRDLRLLVHRRQKLLRYLRRKERGGPRWQNLIEKLGLTEGTWKGEISLA